MVLHRRIVFLFGLLALCWRAGGSENEYDEHSLVKLHPKTSSHLEAIKDLDNPEHGVQILKRSRTFDDTIDLLVPANRVQYVQAFAATHNITHDVRENYERTLESPERTPRRRMLRGFNIFEYHSYAEMQEYLDVLANKCPNIVKLQTLGNSYQGRKVRLVKLSSNHNAGNPVIFIDAGIHAREWVAPAMAMYLIQRLAIDPDAAKDLNGVDWYILPVVNPDGYEFTRSSKANRLWRKTRSKNANCFGVDGNRNYGFKWAVSGVSKNPCDKETYAGPKPFSEPETQMVKNALMEYGKQIKLYVSLHAYGQYLVYPWGYTGDYLPREWKKLDSLARMVSTAVQAAGGKPFRVMSAGKWYPAAGGSDDFAFGVVGVPYSYTMELTDGYEFTYPERLLKTVLPQFFEGFRAFGTQIRREFSPSRHKRDE
ncbi:carboxypeptidase B-like [Leptidea sinapis]|uniref:carboxypeptidase B-like n=1 Tax=Leptidea sinapis TaxID=189913 RepID=UPI002141F1EC|nr:carboxypeptidase B-like [Leptidea sinapis]